MKCNCSETLARISENTSAANVTWYGPRWDSMTRGAAAETAGDGPLISDTGKSSVDSNILSADESIFRARQPRDKSGNLFGFGEPPNRHSGHQVFYSFVAQNRTRQFSVDKTRGHTMGENSIHRDFGRQRGGQSIQGKLAGRVRAAQLFTDLSENRADVYDAAPLLSFHSRQDSLAKLESGRDVDRLNPLKICQIDFGERRNLIDAGIIDQHVKLTLSDLFDESSGRCLIEKVDCMV